MGQVQGVIEILSFMMQLFGRARKDWDVVLATVAVCLIIRKIMNDTAMPVSNSIILRPSPIPDRHEPVVNVYESRLENIHNTSEIPNTFLCPISHEIMVEPVILITVDEVQQDRANNGILDGLRASFFSQPYLNQPQSLFSGPSTSYERSSIDRHLAFNNNTCPITQRKIIGYVKNNNLANIIEAWVISKENEALAAEQPAGLSRK